MSSNSNEEMEIEIHQEDEKRESEKASVSESEACNLAAPNDPVQRQRIMTVRGFVNEIPETESISLVTTAKEHFQYELEQFKEERKKKIWEIPREDITLDFKELTNEWTNLKNDWKSSKGKRKASFSEFSRRFAIGFFFTVIPNCLIVLDYIAAYEYLYGTFYPTLHWVSKSLNCKKIDGTEIKRACFEKDPAFGYLTLTLTFQAGLFWSFLVIYQYWTHLRETKPETFKNKRMFLVFVPIALLGMVTFPLQLLVISLLSCLNDQEQWINLTVKVGIAEGLFNAHFQWLLQTFIFLYQADRQPSTFQFLAAFGSLVFLAYSRVESFMLERGGHREKDWDDVLQDREDFVLLQSVSLLSKRKKPDLDQEPAEGNEEENRNMYLRQMKNLWRN